VSSGKHILEFKKGAFASILPIKPYIIKNNNRKFDLSGGVLNLFTHLLISLCYFYHNIEVFDLPIILPEDDWLNKYKENDLEDKWKTFAKITKNIMAEIGELSISNKSFRHNIEYRNLLYM